MLHLTQRFTHQISFTRVYQIELDFAWCKACDEWHIINGQHKWGAVALDRWGFSRELPLFQDFPQQ